MLVRMAGFRAMDLLFFASFNSTSLAFWERMSSKSQLKFRRILDRILIEVIIQNERLNQAFYFNTIVRLSRKRTKNFLDINARIVIQYDGIVDRSVRTTKCCKSIAAGRRTGAGAKYTERNSKESNMASIIINHQIISAFQTNFTLLNLLF